MGQLAHCDDPVLPISSSTSLLLICRSQRRMPPSVGGLTSVGAVHEMWKTWLHAVLHTKWLGANGSLQMLQVSGPSLGVRSWQWPTHHRRGCSSMVHPFTTSRADLRMTFANWYAFRLTLAGCWAAQTALNLRLCTRPISSTMLDCDVMEDVARG